jgi:hypothetical protein
MNINNFNIFLNHRFQVLSEDFCKAIHTLEMLKTKKHTLVWK